MSCILHFVNFGEVFNCSEDKTAWWCKEVVGEDSTTPHWLEYIFRADERHSIFDDVAQFVKINYFKQEKA